MNENMECPCCHQEMHEDGNLFACVQCSISSKYHGDVLECQIKRIRYVLTPNDFIIYNEELTNEDYAEYYDVDVGTEDVEEFTEFCSASIIPSKQKLLNVIFRRPGADVRVQMDADRLFRILRRSKLS